MKKLALVGVVTLVSGVVAYTAGCGGSSGSPFNPSGDDGGVDGTVDDSGCFLGCDDGGDPDAQQALIVTPPNTTLAVTGSSTPTQKFTVTLGGKDITSSVTWSFSLPAVGDVLSNATFTPTGKVGGSGVLTATFGNAKGQASVTVTVDKSVVGGGVTNPVQTALDNPTGGADPSMSLVYPYNDTFFPLAVLAPEMMWNGVAANDVYKLKITEKYMTYTEYFVGTSPARKLLNQPDWDAIESSGSGPKSDPIKVELTRYSGGKAYNAITQTWHVVQGKLFGSVYYWELPDACGNGNGRILRIKPNSTTVDPFFTNNGACWGCHTVSRDGRYVNGNFNFDFSPVDVSSNVATKGGQNYGSGTFSAYNDDGKKVLIARGTGSHQIDLMDTTTSAALKTDFFGGFAGEPAWSPDGKKVAAIVGINSGGWEFDSTTGDLAIGDFGNNVIANKKTIITKASGTGRPAYPSFAPTSDYIAYGRPTAGSRSTGNGDLWITDLNGVAKKLDIASKDGPTLNTYRAFNPVYAPLRAGGYNFLVFISRRDYGNRLVNTNRQQLWITAVDDPPTGNDPSHYPFYVRGQEDCGKSENAYYALDPCKKNGADCTSGIDCCGGNCNKDPNTQKYVCGDPTGSCVASGNKCANPDGGAPLACCDVNESCIDGFCQKKGPN